jgi:tRNA(adenine34) deaminase
MWDQLELPWRACLEEAWTAYCAGSVPIGAVITGPDGAILTRGRNRIHEKNATAGLISNSPLAHAEVNALLALDFASVDHHNCHLYTTTEPCPMCLGAIYVAGIYHLHYASRDPIAGSANLLGKTPYLAQKPLHAYEPADPELEALVISLFVEYAIMDQPLPDAAMQKLIDFSPEAVDLGRSMAATGVLRRLRTNGGSAREMVETITAHLSI